MLHWCIWATEFRIVVVWFLFVSFGLFKLQFIMRIFHFLIRPLFLSHRFCSSENVAVKYANVHPLASCICLPVFYDCVREPIYFWLWLIETKKEKKIEETTQKETAKLFHSKLVLNVDASFGILLTLPS